MTTLWCITKRGGKQPHNEMSIPFRCYASHTFSMNETWRDRAKARMKELGVTQDALSEKLEMTQGGLQHWLAGTRQPSLDDINRIAAELTVPCTWLTHGVSQEDTLDGLAETSKIVLRRLIQLDRSNSLPSSFWHAIEAMANTVAPSPTSPEKSQASTRNGTHG